MRHRRRRKKGYDRAADPCRFLYLTWLPLPTRGYENRQEGVVKKALKALFPTPVRRREGREGRKGG